MKEEDNILRKAGTGTPFTVPDGYFEKLTSEVMESLPEREKSVQESAPSLWERVKPWTYMAAMFVGAALIIRVASGDRQPGVEKEATVAVTDTEYLSDQYIHTALDGSMMDDYSLYVYLSDVSEE